MRKSQISDPWNIYLAQLVGITKPPKVCQGYQEWMASENNTKILATAVEERWEEELLSGASSKPNTKTRMAVAWELFQALPEEERSEWLARAKNTAQHNKKEYNNLLKVPPSKNPVDRQM